MALGEDNEYNEETVDGRLMTGDIVGETLNVFVESVPSGEEKGSVSGEHDH